MSAAGSRDDAVSDRAQGGQELRRRACPRVPAVVAALAALKADMAKAGVLLASEALKPSSLGVRLKFAGPTRTVIDGPFTESKELIAGFVIVEAQSIDEVIAWNTPFAHLIGDVEIDVRPLAG